MDDYVNKLDIKGLSRKIFQPEGMPPLIVYVVEGSGSGILFYGKLPIWNDRAYALVDV